MPGARSSATVRSAVSVGSPDEPPVVGRGARRCWRPPSPAAARGRRPAAPAPSGLDAAPSGEGGRVESHEQPPDRHLVARERAGLVGADEGRRTERLDGVEPTHDRVALGHRRTPSESETVTIAGSPSGMAATASETATSSPSAAASLNGAASAAAPTAGSARRKRRRPRRTRPRRSASTRTAMRLPTRSQLRAGAAWAPRPARPAGAAMRPISVRLAGGGHHDTGRGPRRPRSRRTRVAPVAERAPPAPAPAQTTLGAGLALTGERGLVDAQRGGLDRRASAGTRSPASSRTTSPGNGLLGGMCARLPSRITVAAAPTAA